MTTGWMLSYCTTSTQYFPAGLRLCVVGANYEAERFGLALAGTGTLLPFSGVTQEQFDELQEIINSGIRPWNPEGETFEANLTHHIAAIATAIHRASQMSQGVAPTFQVGVHTEGFDVGISNIFDPAEPDIPFSLTWRERPA